MANLVLKLQCPDRAGIVAKVCTLIASFQGWIMAANQYSDPSNNQFFMRIEIKENSLQCSKDEFLKQLSSLAATLDMRFTLVDMNYKKRVVILVSKEYHCLTELIYRHISKDIDVDLVGVISNHKDHQKLVESFGLKYHYIPFIENQSEQAFLEIEKLLETLSVDLIILARFMRILPKSVCDKYQGKIINIHHSFLPWFAGANPYERALAAGVKMIGATCHYVTAELDQGPIIEQDVIHINHHHSLADIKKLGGDIEKIVLAKGVRYHLEERVMINDNRTIVFEG